MTSTHLILIPTTGLKYTKYISYKIKPNSPPAARAGMCMTTLNDKIYMFGGSGPQATCYYDLQVHKYIILIRFMINKKINGM